MKDKIVVMADANERPKEGDKNHRMTKFGLAVNEDPRFDWRGYGNLDVDLRFEGTPSHRGSDIKRELYISNIFNVELKEPADYIQSALGKVGHLYDQVLTMRELGDPCMVLVLGDDKDVLAAINESLWTRYRGQELGFQIASYQDRLINFESCCGSLGVPVYRWRSSPWKRLLSLADKMLNGGSLMSYRPKPAEGERLEAAASMLFKGLGPDTMKTVLEYYDIRFVPKSGSPSLEDLPGIGKKRAAMIRPMVIA